MIKIYNNFFNMRCDVHYNPAKFEIKLQLVYGVIKRQIILCGKMD